MGTRITFNRTDGKPAEGYLAKPGRAYAPGLVVIQEWWGVQAQITSTCDRFAAAGFEALAPDLFNGKTVPYHDVQSASAAMSALDFIEAADNNVRGAATYLKSAGARVGLTGFCLGGAMTILGAIRVPEFAAGVCFYGLPPETVAHPSEIQIPLQAHFANTDNWCTPALVNKFEAAAKKAKAPVEICRYDAAHGFMNEQRQAAHNRMSAELCWERMLGFLERHLKQSN
jgi:carboxymethylenebutenolidase